MGDRLSLPRQRLLLLLGRAHRFHALLVQLTLGLLQILPGHLSLDFGSALLEFLLWKNLVNGLSSSPLFRWLVRMGPERLMKRLVVPAGFDVGQESEVQSHPCFGIQLIVKSHQAVRLR